MRYLLLFSPAATEDFERLELKTQQRTVERLRWFLENDVLPEPLEGNFKGLFKLRVGDYRIVYDFSGATVMRVLMVRHRSKAYEDLARD